MASTLASIAHTARTRGQSPAPGTARTRKAPRRASLVGIGAHKLLRILVASYFIGISLGLAPGIDTARLLNTILPSEQAEQVGAAIVFALSWLILAGMWLRPAVLLLALFVFWSSFVQNVLDMGAVGSGDFWRDLTLMGALMLTYVRLGPEAGRKGSLLRFTPKVRRLGNGAQITPRRVQPLPSKVSVLRPRGGEKPRKNRPEEALRPLDDVQNIFLDPPELAMR